MNTTRKTSRWLGLCGLLALALAAPQAQAHRAHAASHEVRAPHLRSGIALIYDEDTHRTLYAKGADDVAPIASITKLMTAMVILDAHLPMEQKITLTRQDEDHYKGSRSRMRRGMTLTRGELLKLALLASENRAAAALARTFPGGTQAVVEHIHESPKLGCRTLFATHYHELTALSERLPRVRNQRVEVLEEGESVKFLHRVVPGGADRSYGIHVAAVAGLPSAVIARARQVLGELERQRPLEPPELQLGLPMEIAPDPLRKELEEIQPDSLSPLEALQKLYQLRAKLNP